MTLSITEDRFRALGLKVPDLSFMKKNESPLARWGQENPFNTRVLLGNWYEDRRAYQLNCARCTGHSITRTDYLDHCKEDYMKKDTCPPSRYAQKLRDEGQGPDLLRNTEDYCDYLSNYTTTYDLMHNWEVRRAGCKTKPWRKWKMVYDNHWSPERDNTLSFGNLTQVGYRKAPQLPLLPNDWDVYANNSTSYSSSYGPPIYPDHYVHVRRAATKEIRRENEEMITRTDPCYKCKPDHKKDQQDNCVCLCHTIDAILDGKGGHRTRANPIKDTPRFSSYKSPGETTETPGKQTLYSTDGPFPYRVLKHPLHSIADPKCKPRSCFGGQGLKCKEAGGDGQPFSTPDDCFDYAGDVGFN